MISTLSARMPDTVAAYLSAGSEPGTLQLVAWLAAHRVRVLLPVLVAPDRRPARPAGLGAVRGAGRAPDRRRT